MIEVTSPGVCPVCGPTEFAEDEDGFMWCTADGCMDPLYRLAGAGIHWQEIPTGFIGGESDGGALARTFRDIRVGL